MRNIFIIFGILLFMGCASTKPVYVPTQAETIIEYRDSIIHIIDSIKVEVPKEKIVEVIPDIDTSYLETKLAYSMAFIDKDKGRIHHTLENKPQSLKIPLDTLVKIEYINKYIEKPIIQEVEVPVKYIPKWCWFCIFFTFGYGVWLLAKIWFRFR